VTACAELLLLLAVSIDVKVVVVMVVVVAASAAAAAAAAAACNNLSTRSGCGVHVPISALISARAYACVKMIV